MDVRRLIYIRCLHDQMTAFQNPPISAFWSSKPFLSYSYFTFLSKINDTSIGITRIIDAESSLFARVRIASKSLSNHCYDWCQFIALVKPDGVFSRTLTLLPV